jgi:cell wall-associated protease
LTAITPSLAAPQPAGTPITFTATATGGTTPYEFKWWTYDGATWTPITGWSTSNTYTLTPMAANANYRVGVWIRNAGSTADIYDNANSNGSIAYPIDTPVQLTLTAITPSVAAPQPVNTSITFTASASGGLQPRQFKWWVLINNVWTVVRDWSTDATYTWTPTAVSPDYRVAVWIRNAGSTADIYDNANSNGSIAYPITATAAPSLSSLSPTSGPVGTSVTIAGSNFGATQDASTVTFNGTTAANVTNWTTSAVTATVPGGAPAPRRCQLGAGRRAARTIRSRPWRSWRLAHPVRAGTAPGIGRTRARPRRLATRTAPRLARARLFLSRARLDL